MPTKAKKKLNLPRVPLPPKVGGAHKVKKDILARKAKHKGSLRWIDD